MSAIAVPRYSRLSIGLHWLMLLLIAAAYATMELRGFAPRGSFLRELMKSGHFVIGLSILALVLVRIAERLRSPAPPITPAPVAWQALAAKGAHLALYALMIGMPIVGWLILSAEGQAVNFLGLELPMLVDKNHGLAERAEDLHELAANIGYFLIGAHAVAALFHHYVASDDTLKRMLPGRR